MELLVPEMQKRGLMQTEYTVPGGTLRENLTRIPGQHHLMEDHFGSTFAWEKTWEKRQETKSGTAKGSKKWLLRRKRAFLHETNIGVPR